MSKVLVVTFDGMDKDLIRDYNCENLLGMEEFGTIDNSTGISTIITNELWASFITGKTWKGHGIISKNRPESDFLFEIEKLNRYKFFRKFMGIRRSIYDNIPFLNSSIRAYDKRDLKSDTLFEKVPSSKAIDVRSYNLIYNVDMMSGLKKGVSAATKELERFTEYKKKELFQAMGEEYSFIMTHFHKPDHIHHWYWEVGKNEKVEKTYHEMDELAGEIMDKAEQNEFEKVIFISDHGLPDMQKGAHNENAFYACNHELFGDEKPHITDFHDRILELISQGGDEIEGVDF
ncbi:MAG: hypothetical protein BRC29_00760 [Nanohaloarchaea archaeon SW_7_43_1]|nr:MAG: hypothetical protein BRC29_00760 [Nanohaloarchaea archaeon SW_7_43_1]